MNDILITIAVERLAITWVPVAAAHPLVHLNVALNLLTTGLLITGWRQIKLGAEERHGRVMAAALATSAAFLVSYLTYHAIAGSVPFTQGGAVRAIYFAVLITHVLLAATVPFLAVPAALFGARALGWLGGGVPTPEVATRLRAMHRNIVKWTFPIWLYVSISGVIVYLMLYVLWPSATL